jgi:hypothetical protein
LDFVCLRGSKGGDSASILKVRVLLSDGRPQRWLGLVNRDIPEADLVEKQINFTPSQPVSKVIVRTTHGVIRTIIFVSSTSLTIGAVGGSHKDAKTEEKCYFVPNKQSLVGMEMIADELSPERTIRFISQKNF